MRLQVVTLSDGLDRGFANLLAGRHRATAPVRHAHRFGLERRRHNRLDPIRPELRLAASARRDIPHTVRPLVGDTRPPDPHRLAINPQLLGDLTVGLPTGRRERNLAAQGDLLRRAERRHPSFESLLIRDVEREWGNHSGHNASIRTLVPNVQLFVGHYDHLFTGHNTSRSSSRRTWAGVPGRTTPGAFARPGHPLVVSVSSRSW